MPGGVIEANHDLRKFFVPELMVGEGARYLAGRFASNLHTTRVLVVTDAGVRAAGWVDDVLESLRSEDIGYVVFGDVLSNPRIENVMAGTALYARENCNGIVAVGGGSPMDCAKGIGVLSANHRDILEFEGVDRVARPGPPLICIPTTAGSSADVSQFAILVDRVRRLKIAIIAKSLVPDISLLDPVPLTTLSASLTAETGIDALSHAIEAYVSNASSPVTDLHALEAVRILAGSLSHALEDPRNVAIRYQTMLGSLYAGFAFSNASLGLLHAMSHSLGGYLDLSHGLCNALLLEHIIRYNYPAASPKYDRIAEALGASVSAGRDALVTAVQTFRESLGITGTLSDYGISAGDIPVLTLHAMRDPCLATNPVNPTRDEISELFHHALKQ